MKHPKCSTRTEIEIKWMLFHSETYIQLQVNSIIFATVTRNIHFQAFIYWYNVQIWDLVQEFSNQFYIMAMKMNDYFLECSYNINPVFLYTMWHKYSDTCVCGRVSLACVYSVKRAWSQPSHMWSSVSIPYQQHFVVPASLSVLFVCTTSLPDSQQPPKYTCTLSHCRRRFSLLPYPTHPSFTSNRSHGFWCYLHTFLNNCMGNMMHLTTHQKLNEMYKLML